MVARTWALQAELARRRGRLEEAAFLAMRAGSLFQERGLRDHPAAIEACGTRGLALLALSQRAQAAGQLAPCLAAAERQFVPGDRRTEVIRRALESALGG